MGLILPQKVRIDVSGNMASYYENLGYKIPRYFNKRHNTYTIANGTTIDVSVEDLKPNSNIIVECECDICHRKENITKMEYTRIKSYTEKYGYDYLCLDCKFDIMPTAKLKVGTFKNNEAEIKRFLIRKLITFVENNGYPKRMKTDFKPENKMPSLRMYKEYLGGDLVDWLEMCGYILTSEEKYEMRTRGGQSKNLSKKDCTNIIMEMQSKLDRPLEYSDFKNPKMNEIGISLIKKYWGTLNKMKVELGLEITQESMMDKQLSKNDFDQTVEEIINYLHSEGRNFITTREINDDNRLARYGTLDRMCKKYYKEKLTEHLLARGISFGKQGHGLNYDFDDGEHVASQYEYMFSKFLKENKFEYNKNYFRDVKYSSFVENYSGNMNCDYEIHIGDNILYIEIAGIIGDYKTWYYEDRKIVYSESKEKYRIKLKEKERLLKENNIKYFILFPCDLTKDNFNNIVNNSDLALKHSIENFHKNNIDWNKVRKIGELDYSKDVMKEDNRYKNRQKEAV